MGSIKKSTFLLGGGGPDNKNMQRPSKFSCFLRQREWIDIRP